MSKESKKSFKQYLAESTSDKGILKAVFVVGIPGAGKTYTLSKLAGPISPKIINTDRAAEFLSKKNNEPINAQTWPGFKDDVHRITQSTLSGYLDGMLPLFVDSTSNNASSILARAGILESLGYDVGMIFIDTDLDTALERAKNRAVQTNRFVDEDFIRKVYAESHENKAYFASKFAFFKHIVNDSERMDDKTILAAFKETQNFFSLPVENPVGKRVLFKLHNEKQKFLTPLIFSQEGLKKKVDNWYRD